MAMNSILQIFKSGTDQNPRYIRPTPLISISRETLRNSLGDFGGRYTITLTGTILDQGGAIDANVATQPSIGTIQPDGDAAFAIFEQQEQLKSLFTEPVLRFEINNIDGGATPSNVFYVRLQSLNFEDGVFVNTGRYTAVFTAEYMTYDGTSLHDGDKMANLIEANDGDLEFDTIGEERTSLGGVVSDYTETWSIEVDDSLGVTSDTAYDKIITPRSYRVTRDISVTGRDYLFEDSTGGFKKSEAWSEAKGFASKVLLTDHVEDYPDRNSAGLLANNVINLSAGFGGYNHFRVENIDKTAGIVNINDTWLICSGTAFENYSSSISSSNDNPYVSVTLNGTIKGVSSISASGEYYGGKETSNLANPYDNALKKYYTVSNNGSFGINSSLYKRANSIVEPGLNPQPLSISLSDDKFAGEITYSLQFDNRPQNVVTEAISETISVNDTYPGDLYALIPVIGRPSGPVLQYIGGRTEYKRDVSLELVFDYTDIDYGNNTGAGIRKKLILSKPSLNNPTRDQINDLVKQLSPMSEPSLRKCFLNPPQESWNPKEGRYSLNLSWVYELGDSDSSPASNPPAIPGQTS